MEQTRPPLNIFRPDDLVTLAGRLLQAPVRLRASTAALLAALAASMGLLGDLLFSRTQPGLNLPLWHFALVGTLLAGSMASGVRLERRQLFLLGFALLLSSLIAWRASLWLQTLNLAAAAAVTLLAVAFPVRDHNRMGFVSFLYTLAVGALSVASGVLRLALLLPWREIGRSQPGRTWTAARGILLTLPLLVVFGALFIAADAVFEERAHSIVSLDLGRLPEHVFLFVFFSIAAAGVYWAALGFDTPEPPEAAMPEPFRLRLFETSLLLGSLCLLFGLFVAVQLRYLFGGEDLVERSLDLTYAQYARRGFFELVAAAALLLPVLLLVDWARQRGKVATTVYRVLSIALVVLLAVVMASALERLRIYSDTFGLTELRLYSASFLVLLCFVFLWFCGTVLTGRAPLFLPGALVLGGVALVVLNLGNPDALIAQTNTSRLDDGRSFDAAHASLLSADAVPVLVERLDAVPQPERCLLATGLLDRWLDDSEGFRSLNLAREQARDAVRNNLAKLRAACNEQGSPS